MVKSQLDLIDKAYDRFLTTLSNKTRLAIIYALKEKPKNVTQLTNELRANQTSISHGLKRLLTCGFVFVEQNGRERVYAINNKTIKPLLNLIESHVGSYCAKCLQDEN